MTESTGDVDSSAAKDSGRYYKVPVDGRFMTLLWKRRVVRGGTPIAQLVTEALQEYLHVKIPDAQVDSSWTPRASPNRKPPVGEEAVRS